MATMGIITVSGLLADGEREISVPASDGTSRRYVAYGVVDPDGIGYRLVHAPTKDDLVVVADALERTSAVDLAACVMEADRETAKANEAPLSSCLRDDLSAEDA